MEKYYNDPDPEETSEWLESLNGVIRYEGSDKTDYLLRELTARARSKGVLTSPGILSSYMNTIPPDKSENIPGDSKISRNVSAYVRWNVMAMVGRANKDRKGLGGHIASFASAET